MNGWKQPTPTDGQTDPNLNDFDWMIFCYVWNFVRREKGIYEFWHGNRFFSIELERGQCVFKINRLAKEMEIHRRVIHRSLKKLQKWYTEVNIEGKPFGTVLTFKNVDSMLKMDNEVEREWTTRGQREDNERTTSKESVESVENEKTVKREEKKITPEYLVQLVNKKENKNIDVPRELTKFEDYCRANGKRYKNHRAAFRNWLRRAEDFSPPKKGGAITID